MSKKIRVCYVLCYRAPDYIRTQTLLSALATLADIELFKVVNRHKNWLRYFEVLFQLFRIKKQFNPEVYILGFRGHEIYWLVRLLLGRKIIIFDAMMSPYLAVSEENRCKKLSSLFAKILFYPERWIFQDADKILTDTNLHRQIMSETFNVSQNKISVIPVGAIENQCFNNQIKKQEKDSGKKLNVFFYGSFLPLHGIDIILSAIRMCADLPLHFELIGGKDEGSRIQSAFDGEIRCTYTHTHHVSFPVLIEKLSCECDINLGGPFGNTPQALRVVTGKTQQSLFFGIPTIIGKIDHDYGFEHQKNCLLVEQGNTEQLAVALRWAYEHRDQLSPIGLGGKNIYRQEFSQQVIAKQLAKIISSLPN